MFIIKLVSVMGALIGVSSAEFEGKKSVKRGIDDFGYPVGYNGWAASLKLNPLYNAPLLNYDKPNVFLPSSHDLSHLVAAAKQAQHDAFLAQQYINAAKEDVLQSQKLVKEKEALALIAHQKSESAQHVLRNEAHNVVMAQQKLAKAKAFAAELQLKLALKNSEAAKAIQTSASHAHSDIQKAEQAARFSNIKQSFGVPYKPVAPLAYDAFPAYPPSIFAPKPLAHHHHHLNAF